MDLVGQLTAAFNEMMAAGGMLWIKIGVFLWTVEKVLEFVSRLTPWNWDDNIGVILGNLIGKVFKRQ